MTQLTEKQEIILYRIALLQDEQGRQTSMMLKNKLLESDVYKPLLDEQLLVCKEEGSGAAAIANLMVSDKGMRYCYENLNRLNKLNWNSRPQF